MPKFSDRLSDCLLNTLVNFNDRELDEFIIMRTYCQLFKFLVVDSKGNLDHQRYLESIAYLREVKTIGMKLLSKGAGKIITKVNNPSLPSERAFRIALQQYLRVARAITILQRLQRFVIDNNSRSSFQVFKQDLHFF